MQEYVKQMSLSPVDTCDTRRDTTRASTTFIMSVTIPHPDQQPAAEPPSVPEIAPAPEEEEEASETLYIQNLNERIQIPGAITTRSHLGSFATHRTASSGST